MAWKKQGRIFHLEPSGSRSSTHAQVPTPLVRDSYIRIYFAARREGKSYPAFIDLDRKDLRTVLRVQEAPIMAWGEKGTFDSDGIMPSCIIEQGKELWMYYTGWNALAGEARYLNRASIAVSTDGGETFHKKFSHPVLDTTPEEPGMAVTPFVLREKDGWKMWYVSGTSWEKIGGQYEPIYVIKYAESDDGISWRRPNIVCVPQRDPLEALSNPSVLFRDGVYHLWYSTRGSRDFRDGKESYRIGYATSKDGKHFTRDDAAAGITVSKEGWDATMLCYPYVFELDGRLLLLHNGNGFGQSGIGLAIRQ